MKSKRIAGPAVSARVALLLGGVICLAGSGLAQAADSRHCDRSCLEQFVGTWAAALVRHDPSGLPLAPDFKATENGLAVKPGEGSWKSVESFTSQPQFVADVDAQEVGYVGVVQDAGKPAFYGLRLKIRNGRIQQAESILTHDGEGGPAFEPVGFIYREAPYIRDVPAAKRDSRAQLLKVANLYWDVSTSTHLGQTLPYSVDCWHFENGMNTDWERPFMPDELAKPNAPENQPQAFDGRIWTCAREAILSTSAWTRAHDRHFLVDPQRGLVMNIVYVDVAGRGNLGGPPATGNRPAAGASPAGAQGGPTAGPAGPGGRAAVRDPIEGPGRMPLGMSVAGMKAAMSGKPYTMAHFEVMRIVGGKIAREQDVMRTVSDGASRPF